MAKIDELYHNLCQEILDKGFDYEDENREGVIRKQIPSYTINYNFDNGFPAITTKKLYWKSIIGELIWFLRGETNTKYLVENGIHIWDKDADKNGNLGRIYGKQWREWADYSQNSVLVSNDYAHVFVKHYDQIEKLIHSLKNKPMSTQHIVTAWNPAELNQMNLPPCHWSFEILVEPIPESEIPKHQFTLKWHQRSVDVFLGLPFNIASYSMLAHIIEKMTGMRAKGIIADLSNVHIYHDHLEVVREQLKRDVNKHDACAVRIGEDALEMIKRYNNKEFSLDTLFEEFKIEDFTLSDYSSYSSLRAEMLSRD